MFNQLTILDAEQHASLRFSANQPYDFAREQVLVPVVSSEITRVAREMPVVFPLGSEVPQALAGMPPGVNVHVQDSGHWRGRYIPAHIRRYPFMLAPLPKQQETDEQRYAMQFDAAARHFESAEGQPLLDAQGRPTALLRKIQQVLVSLMHDHAHTARLVAELDLHGLLKEKDVTLGQGDSAQSISGVRIVNESVLRSLEPQALAELRDSGALALAYAHVLSLSNLDDGIITRLGAAAKATPDIDELFGGDDFTFDFDG